MQLGEEWKLSRTTMLSAFRQSRKDKVFSLQTAHGGIHGELSKEGKETIYFVVHSVRARLRDAQLSSAFLTWSAMSFFFDSFFFCECAHWTVSTPAHRHDDLSSTPRIANDARLTFSSSSCFAFSSSSFCFWRSFSTLVNLTYASSAFSAFIPPSSTDVLLDPEQASTFGSLAPTSKARTRRTPWGSPPPPQAAVTP